MYVQQQIQWSSQQNLKWHQQYFPRWQTMLQQPFLRAFWEHPLAYLTIFLGSPYLLMKDPHTPSPRPLLLPKTTVMERTIVEIVVERAVSLKNMVIPCSLNKVRILSAKDGSFSRIFSRVCLILATYVWRSFQFCDSISSLACFLVFKSSNLSLHNCLCSSE